MKPMRIDYEMTSGSQEVIDFPITDLQTGAPINITTDTVYMYISMGQGIPAHIKKTSSPGAHQNAASGIVRFTVTPQDVPARTYRQVWWYEIWRVTSAGVPTLHRVGELQLLSTVRIN